MKNKNRFGFLTGFTLSCLLHVTLTMLYFYHNTQKEGIKSVIREPLRLSLNMFAPEPKKEEVVEVKQQPKPKPEPRIKPKPKPKPEIAKVPLPEEIIEEDKQEISEEVQEQELQMSSAASIIEDESYKLLIVAAIEKYKGYPSKAKRMNMEGLVTVKLKIDINGNLISAEVVDGSGYGVLDFHTIKSVEKASKEFPKLPHDMTFTVPISYKLDRNS